MIPQLAIVHVKPKRSKIKPGQMPCSGDCGRHCYTAYCANCAPRMVPAAKFIDAKTVRGTKGDEASFVVTTYLPAPCRWNGAPCISRFSTNRRVS